MGKVLETSENAKQEYLRTNYYKSNYQLVKKALMELIEKNHYEIIDNNDEYGEVFVKNQIMELNFKIIQVNAIETSLDIILTSNALFDFGKSKRVIEYFYSEMKKRLNFIGKSLHR